MGRNEEYGYKLFDVHVKAFPLNLRTNSSAWNESTEELLNESTPEPGIIFRHTYFESLVYNETPTLVADITPECMRKNCDPDDMATLEGEYGYSSAGARFFFSYTGCVIAMFALKAPESVLQVSGEELRKRGVIYFRSTCPIAGLLYTLIEVISKTKLVVSPPAASYDLFEHRDKQTFMDEMEWRAWSSSSHVAIGSEANKLTWPSVKDYKELNWVRNDNPSVKAIDNNYLGWLYTCQDTEASLNNVYALLEPIGFIMSQRSICSSGLHNMRTIASRFAYDQPMHIPVDDLRRYVALVRTNLMSCQIYEESSEKGARQVYTFMMQELDMPHQTGRLEQAMDAVSASITGMESVHDERFQRRVSLAVMIFTCLTIVSVAADVSGFIDIRNTLLSVPDRVQIVLASFGLSLAMVLGLWGALGRRNPLHRSPSRRSVRRLPKLNNDGGSK